MGVLMVFNTSSAEILDRDLDIATHQATTKQLLFAFVGVMGACVIYWIGYRELLKLALPILALVSLLLLFVFLPGIGLERNGAHRWVKIGSYTLQPSELAKLAVPLYYVSALMRYRTERGISLKRLALVGGVIAIPMGLVLLEPDNGTTGIIGLSLVSLLLLSRVKLRYWLLPMVIVLAIGGTVAMQLPYVRQRLNVYLHPEVDLKGRGHQPYQAKIAAGSGELFGRGLGQSMQKLTYLPEAQNDYIAAIYAEEFGWAGVMVLILLYALLIYWGYQVAANAADLEGFLLAASLTFVIGLQVFLNLGVVSGLLPSTGLNLPYFSQGGTSLIANMAAIGLLLDIDSHASRRRLLERPV
jgi:cell division protein FtsW